MGATARPPELPHPRLAVPSSIPPGPGQRPPLPPLPAFHCAFPPPCPILQRVVDLLRLKEALDSGLPLERVPLHLPLQVRFSIGNPAQSAPEREHPVVPAAGRGHALP